MLPAYSYSPLSSGQSRVLELLPGDSNDDEILVQISTISLGAGGTHSYEALSYVWGSETNPRRIVVASGPEEAPTEKHSYLNVTRNLFEALQYLRRSDASRRLWIDAICINQKDIPERNEQVRHMRLIYTTAIHIVVWLGPAAQDTDGAIEILRRLAETVQALLRCAEVPTPSETTGTAAVKTEYMSTMTWLGDPTSTIDPLSRTFVSCRALFNRPWFERLWIRQEVYGLLPRTTFHCGLESISAEDLRLAVCIWSARNADDQTKEALNTLGSKVLRTLDTGFARTLDGLLASARDAKCSDPRDKVYGVLGMLANGEDASAVKVDYAMPVVDLYTMVVRVCVGRYRDLRILSYCRPNDAKLQLPTWVPDWTVPVEGYNLHEQYVAFVSSDESPGISGGVLEVEGLQATQLSSVEDLNVSAFLSHTGAFDELRRLFAFLSLRLLHTSQDSLIVSMAAVISSNDDAEYLSGAVSGKCDYPPLSTLESTLKQIMMLSTEELLTSMQNDNGFSKDVKILIKKAAHTFRVRTIAITEAGHCAVVPHDAVPGDVLCFLIGLPLAMALRPCGVRSYQIVGTCFVFGLNRGEALLGEMPSGWSCKRCPSNGTMATRGHVFVNENTGVTSLDPRIAWESLRISEDHPQAGSDLALRARQLYGYPVRPLDKQYLIEDRGVVLQKFKLI